MLQRIVHVKDYLTSSGLTASDYVINPYVGCPHNCLYCYASYMQRVTGHTESWGNFIDIRYCDKKIDINKLAGKKLTLSSVTDCYNQEEENFQITRNILSQLVGADVDLTIITKSDLVVRDIDLLKKMKNVKVVFSINTTDENFKRDMDKAPSIARRLQALRTLHENGIRTFIFVAPYFPEITDFKAIIEKSKDFVDCYWFDKLNLRGPNKEIIFDYIKQHKPTLLNLYKQIFNNNDFTYWDKLSKEIDTYCKSNNISYDNFIGWKEK